MDLYSFQGETHIRQTIEKLFQFIPDYYLMQLVVLVSFSGYAFVPFDKFSNIKLV